MKNKLFLCIGILLVSCLIGCIDHSASALVGKWVEVDDPSNFYVFLQDGKGIDDEDRSLTWSVPEGKYDITIQIEGFNAFTDNFWVSGSKLILGGVEYKKSK